MTTPDGQSLFNCSAEYEEMENNPWNPGARLVMARIPFDKDAEPLSPVEARRLLRSGGFARCSSLRTLFYFPRPLAFLRPVEPLLALLPLGAQYYILGIKEGGPECATVSA
jgi:hypothetical protein